MHIAPLVFPTVASVPACAGRIASLSAHWNERNDSVALGQAHWLWQVEVGGSVRLGGSNCHPEEVVEDNNNNM